MAKDKSIRVRPKDLEGAIFTPKKVDFDKRSKVAPSEESYYTILGKHDFVDGDGCTRANYDNDHIYAKKIINPAGIPSYHIMIGSDGQLENPLQGVVVEHNKDKLDINQQYLKCSERMFNHYVNFLKTKNLAWYNQARREVI